MDYEVAVLVNEIDNQKEEEAKIEEDKKRDEDKKREKELQEKKHRAAIVIQKHWKGS